ncbi:MAG: Rieske (2Fe-2S) protein [Desmonostoc vinosum HA7617-LM4]|jgi:hypothetical protein|nr:Rieske (2Fe-2S) protein [Desmonostoc vinosum HA7617-LM4]
MPIIKFDPRQSNFLIHGDRRYFLTTIDGSAFLVVDKCPHRGGPLHLGYLNCRKNAIVCPWHDSSVSIHRLQQLAIPLIWRHDVVVAILPGSETTPVIFKHRNLLATPEISTQDTLKVV